MALIILKDEYATVVLNISDSDMYKCVLTRV